MIAIAYTAPWPHLFAEESMFSRSWRSISGICVLTLLLLGCGSSAASVAAAPTPTTVPIASPTLPAACFAQTTLCAQTIILLDKPGQQRLPDTLGSQPQPSSAFTFGPPPANNAIFISGNAINILLSLVNPTSSAITVDSLMLRVAGFTPFGGTIANAFAACDERTYSATAGVRAGGRCDSGDYPDFTYGYPVTLSTSVTVGAIIPLQAGTTSEGMAGSGPVVVAPFQTSNGSDTLVDVAITPQVAGTYQFQVGVKAHDDIARYFAPTQTALAVTPGQIQQFWSATNCTLDSNRGQVPATGTYLCPGPVSG
jgi:hypothetical protein